MPSSSSEVPAASPSATERARARWPERDRSTVEPGHSAGTVVQASAAVETARETGRDGDLVLLMQARDPDAFALVYDRHSAAALGLSRRMVGDRALAEDVTQEAFVSVWRGAANYRPERGSVRTWVMGITRNRAIDALRQRSSRARIREAAAAFAEPTLEPAPTEAEATRRDHARTVRAAIGELPADQRRAIELAYFAGLTHTEIAMELELPLGTVKGRMRLALDKLRHRLSPDEGTI